ncbi:MAG: GAF domain-containing protein [Deltaproteobacteria bacterium]|nr:GAF domain-containing protein [Deltaproteobacteria bacterium]
MFDTLASQSSLVAVIVCVASAVALLLRSTQGSSVRFAGFATAVGLYHASFLAAAVAGDPSLYQSVRIPLAAGVVVAADSFFDGILGERSFAVRRRRRTLFTAVLIALVALTPALELPGVTAALSTLLVGLLWVRLAAVLRQARRIDSAAERTRLRTLAVAGIIAALFSALDLLALAGLPVPTIGGMIAALYVYFLSQAILSSRLLDLHELLGKVLVFGSLALILAVVYGFLFLWVGDRRGFFLSNTLVASSLILILFEPVKVRLEETAARVFFREQLTFSRGLRRLVPRLMTTIELPHAFAAILDEIYEAKRATHASIYLLDQRGVAFTLQDHRGPEPVRTLDGNSHPALVAFLLKAQTPLLREALTRRLAAGEGLVDDDKSQEPLAQEKALVAGLDALVADLVVPLRVQGNVVGFLCLRDERLADAYASDEIAALIAVADQLAINVENSRLFGVLRERDRLAALGEMSAGLAHEIRNPLAAIKGAAQELDPRKLKGDDKELMEIIIDEVNRLNGVVSEFLDYARPFRGTFVGLSVNDAVKRTAQLMQHDLAEMQIGVELADDLPDVSGDSERLQQVLINLVLNAAEATDRKGRVQLTTRVVESFKDAALLGLKAPTRSVEIVVKDDGPGVAAAVQQQIFIPFFTTKERGTGLGLALCQRIVQHHGGQIEVRSVEAPARDHGATFIVRLPALPRRDKDKTDKPVLADDVRGAVDKGDKKDKPDKSDKPDKRDRRDKKKDKDPERPAPTSPPSR